MRESWNRWESGFLRINEVIHNYRTYMTVKEFADKQGIHTKTVYEWIKEGKVIKKKLGSATFVSMA